ncbi:MAG: hypothetical protein WD095_00395, partial [Candidatus Paceibacterota bacterium]
NLSLLFFYSPNNSNEAQEKGNDITSEKEEEIISQEEKLPPINCEFEDSESLTTNCLDANFSSCMPAFIEISTEEEVEVRFEIIGSESPGLCEVEISLSEHPSSIFKNKSMVCSYNNSNSFEDEVINSGITSGDLQRLEEDLQLCSGSLADIMRSFLTP